MSNALIAQIIFLVVVFSVPLVILPGLIWAERRVAGWIQLRQGPNRVGPFGIFQPLADVVKLVFKEDVMPNRVDRFLFRFAPLLAFVPGMVALAVIPMGPGVMVGDSYIPFQGADVGIGILFLLALLGLTAYSLTLGGWASNSKFSQLGGIRATAQVISYELALGIAILLVVIAAASSTVGATGFAINDIVFHQIRTGFPGDYELRTFMGFLPAWNIFVQPLAFVVFLVAAFAEANRAPFDMPEAEPELVGGYHTEFSSFKFAMFFMGEYLAVILQSALIVLFFLGGWHIIGMPVEAPEWGWDAVLWNVIGFLVFMSKMTVVIFFFIWLRWSLPRFRYDQLMSLGWKVLIPLGLVNLTLVMLWSM